MEDRDREKVIAEAEKLIEEGGKEIEAIEARIKEIKKEMLGTLTSGIGGLGVLLVVVGATSSLPSILIWIGSILLLGSLIWGIWIWRH